MLQIKTRESAQERLVQVAKEQMEQKVKEKQNELTKAQQWQMYNAGLTDKRPDEDEDITGESS